MFGGVWLGWLVGCRVCWVGLVGLMEVHGLQRLMESTSEFGFDDVFFVVRPTRGYVDHRLWIGASLTKILCENFPET